MDEVNGKETCQARYDSLARDRDSYLERARDCSRFTIPMLIPDEEVNSAQILSDTI